MGASAGIIHGMTTVRLSLPRTSRISAVHEDSGTAAPGPNPKSRIHNPERAVDAARAGRRPAVAAAWSRGPLCVLGLLAGLQAGCAQWSYDRVRLGQEHGQYARAFPEGGVHRTENALSYLAQDRLGRTDAVVLLLTRDRRVAGKLHAMHFERNYGFKVETGYALCGEVDPELAGVEAAGPIDALRAIADELTGPEGDTVARQTQAWVAAGLVRMVQHWPHVGDEGPAFPRLADTLERVAGGGVTQITVNERGVYMLEYTVGTPK